MLVELLVENYAVVDRIRVRFHAGLNLLTGETGSGKSIVVDAFGLLLGGRASAEMIRSGESRAHVAGIFDVRDRADVRAQLDDSRRSGSDPGSQSPDASDLFSAAGYPALSVSPAARSSVRACLVSSTPSSYLSVAVSLVADSLMTPFSLSPSGRFLLRWFEITPIRVNARDERNGFLCGNSRAVLWECGRCVGAIELTAIGCCGYSANVEPFMMQLWREAFLTCSSSSPLETRSAGYKFFGVVKIATLGDIQRQM